MSKKRILKTLAVMAVMLSLAAAPAMAQSELDQSQYAFNAEWVMQEPAKQTFTAQKTGTLDKVAIVVGCDDSFIREPPFCGSIIDGFPLTVEIKGTQSDPPPQKFVVRGLDWYDVPLDPAPFVEAGKQYEIRLSIVDDEFYYRTQVAWLGGATFDNYSGGDFYYWNGTDWSLPTDSTTGDFHDIMFETYVTPDTTAPEVDVVNPPEDPAQGTAGAARGTNVTATFSERMDPDTLSTSTFKLFKVNKNGATSRITNAPVRLSADGLTARLNPFGSSDTLLNKSTKYKAVVTTGAEDLAGNALDQDPTTLGNQQKVWYFTTG